MDTRLEPATTAEGYFNKALAIIMVHRITLLIPGRAKGQLIKPAGERGYFHWLYVNPRYRRRGYGMELMKFAIEYAQEFLEMDILHRSKTCQRNAARLGYKKTGQQSDRYFRCELWRYRGGKSQCLRSRLRVLKKMRYQRNDGKTEVLYLSNSLD